MFTHAASFVAGVITGWTARSVFGSTREVSVRLMTVAIAARERVRRGAAEQVELWEDLVAEARSRYAAIAREQGRDAQANGHDAQPGPAETLH
jgi:hypothetical protein